MRIASLLVACCFLATVASSLAEEDVDGEEPTGVYAFTVTDIAGKEVELSRYQGKVLLIVNVASKCGNTPQYKDLQALYEKYAAQGFMVLGFPANEFGKQEPGTNDEIAQFCEKNYGVTFDMFAKVVVKGEGKVPLYTWLTSAETNPKFAGEIGWNFAKFLIGKDGQVVARFEPKMKPLDPTVTAAVEAALAK